MRLVLTSVALAAVMAGITPANAGTMVQVPVGTTILLKFLAPLDSSTVQEGTIVKFEVAADTRVNLAPIFLLGAHAQGTVTDVSPPGVFGANAVVHIGFIQAMAVDGRLVRLSPLDVTSNSIRQIKDMGGADAANAAGTILLGPLGLAGGALVRGGHVSVPAGAVGTVKVTHTISIDVPSHLFGDYNLEHARVPQ